MRRNQIIIDLVLIYKVKKVNFLFFLFLAVFASYIGKDLLEINFLFFSLTVRWRRLLHFHRERSQSVHTYAVQSVVQKKQTMHTSREVEGTKSEASIIFRVKILLCLKKLCYPFASPLLTCSDRGAGNGSVQVLVAQQCGDAPRPEPACVPPRGGGSDGDNESH